MGSILRAFLSIGLATSLPWSGITPRKRSFYLVHFASRRAPTGERQADLGDEKIVLIEDSPAATATEQRPCIGTKTREQPAIIQNFFTGAPGDKPTARGQLAKIDPRLAILGTADRRGSPARGHGTESRQFSRGSSRGWPLAASSRMSQSVRSGLLRCARTVEPSELKSMDKGNSPGNDAVVQSTRSVERSMAFTPRGSATANRTLPSVWKANGANAPARVRSFAPEAVSQSTMGVARSRSRGLKPVANVLPSGLKPR
jgi:hypothetical protein